MVTTGHDTRILFWMRLSLPGDATLRVRLIAKEALFRAILTMDGWCTPETMR